MSLAAELTIYRVRTLTGKEIELDIEPDYKVGGFHIPAPSCKAEESPLGGADQGKG